MSADQLVIVANSAFRAFANLGQKDRVRDWLDKLESLVSTQVESVEVESAQVETCRVETCRVETCRVETGCDVTVSRARVAAAFGYWDLGDDEGMARSLSGVSESDLGARDSASLRHARALLALRRRDSRGAVEALSQALRNGRRHLARHEAGRLWNDLVLASVAADDLGGAERACRPRASAAGGL